MSEGDGYYQLQQILTNLAVRVGQMEGTLKTFMENWARQDQLANDGRRITYDKIDLLGKQIERVANDVEGLKEDLCKLEHKIDEEVAPVVKSFEVIRHQRIGAKGVWAMIAGGLVAFASLVTYTVERFMSAVWPKP